MDLPKPEELSCSWERQWTGSRKEKTFIHLEVLKWKKKTFSIDTCTFAYCHALLLFEEESEEENERRRARIKIKLRVLFQLSICPWPTLHARRERLGTRPCSISVPRKRWKHFKKVGIFQKVGEIQSVSMNFNRTPLLVDGKDGKR